MINISSASELTSSVDYFKYFPEIETEDYIIKLASNKDELESIFRLRFQAFNIELGVGYSISHLTQMDQDDFDVVFDHLIIICKQTDQIIGSCRLQTYKIASENLGFYSAKYFNINVITDSVLQLSVELGRVCIAKKYRSIKTFLLLWEGVNNYLSFTKTKYLLGCVSLPTQDPLVAYCAYNYFQQNALMHPNILVYPNSQSFLEVSQSYPDPYNLEIPNILKIYLASGARVCSLPAIDKQFGSIDFLVIFDSVQFGV
ncbi:GNAT family N-acyltransferase [Nostoc punctiforme UO1]|uniref:GNAT family N-acetyltransferase n=1 Tax=Nostoc punctiforme TaxID=272131 RepID=UPI0030AA2346